MDRAPDQDEPTTDEQPELARRRLGLRLLAALLAGLWTGLAVVVLVAYRPGGPWDPLVALSAAIPAAIAVAAIPWPPLTRSWRRSAVITFLGIGAALMVAPLVGVTVTQLVSGGGRTLLPSPEVAYAAVVAVAASSLFVALGLIAARDGRNDPEGPSAVLERRPSVFAAIALAAVMTSVVAVLYGGTALMNEVALRESPVPPSRFGPTDATLPSPRCDTELAIGPGATLEMTAEASIDDEPVGSARLSGQRAGTDETWTGSADGPSGPVVTGYARIDGQAWLLRDGRWVVGRPDPFGLLGRDALTVDGPVLGAVQDPERPPVAEDVGLELIEGAKARHCRTAVDGPTAIKTFLPLRWLAGGDPVLTTAALVDWRGTLDWWVFADGQLGLAKLVLNGYPGDAWQSSGLQGEMHVQLSAIDRAFAHVVQAPTSVVEPPASPVMPPVRASVAPPADPSGAP